MADAPALKREIGLYGAAFIALNGIVGAGIYALPAELASRTGAFSLWLIPIFGALILAVIYVFAELASYFDRTGGPVVYAGEAFGPLAAFQTGWLLYIARVTALAANTNVAVVYLAAYLPALEDAVPRATALALIFLAFTAINAAGVKGAVRTLNLFTVLKIAPLIGFILWALAARGVTPAQNVILPTFEELGGVSLLLLYAFVGFEGAVMTAGETKDARRNLPRALILTALATTALYFFVQLAYLATTAEETVEGAPLVAAGRILAGEAGAAIITLTALFSIGGNLFQIVLTAPRLIFSMAEAGALPAWFARIHPRYATPANAILFTGALGFVVAVSGAFAILAVVSSLSRMFVYLACAAALPALRRRFAEGRAHGLATRAHRLLVPLIAAALCLWAISTASAPAWAWFFGLVLIGAALFGLARLARRP